MRHFLANLATYAIASLLLAGAVAFAILRTSQVVLTTEPAVLARYEPEPDAPFRWEVPGAESYARNCANCHGRSGRGWDQYPGVGHAAALFLAEGGREYLVDVHLYGLASRRWRAPMPPMGHMADVEVAAVVNYVLTHFENEGAVPADVPLLRPEEVAARRGLGLRPEEVERDRPTLGGVWRR